jgi:hypothetical protein
MGRLFSFIQSADNLILFSIIFIVGEHDGTRKKSASPEQTEGGRS